MKRLLTSLCSQTGLSPSAAASAGGQGPRCVICASWVCVAETGGSGAPGDGTKPGSRCPERSLNQRPALHVGGFWQQPRGRSSWAGRTAAPGPCAGAGLAHPPGGSGRLRGPAPALPDRPWVSPNSRGPLRREGAGVRPGLTYTHACCVSDAARPWGAGPFRVPEAPRLPFLEASAVLLRSGKMPTWGQQRGSLSMSLYCFSRGSGTEGDNSFGDNPGVCFGLPGAGTQAPRALPPHSSLSGGPGWACPAMEVGGCVVGVGGEPLCK